MRVRLRRISRILLTCSMLAGQISWQARQVVQAQRTSSAHRLDQVARRGRPSASSPICWTTFMGESGLSGGVGRAAVLAALAGGAGIGVEDVLPGEIGDLGGAELLRRSRLPG